MTRTVSDMPSVALAVTDGMLHYELSVALEVFGADLTHIVDPWYDFSVCGTGPVHVDRFRLEPDHGLDQLAHADTVIVPGWADTDREPPTDLVQALRAAHEAGARVASLCTGAFILGAAGLLDDRRATTHWAHTRELARRHPAATVDPDVLYVDNGDVLTSAGKAAAMDLCLHLVRLDHGAANANKIARRLVIPPHRDGGQAQFIATPARARQPPPGRTLPLGAGATGPTAHRGGPGPPGPHELTPPRPPLQTPHRHHTTAVAPHPAHPPRPGTSGNHQRHRRHHRRGYRHGHRYHAAPPLPPQRGRPTRHLSPHLPPPRASPKRTSRKLTFHGR